MSIAQIQRWREIARGKLLDDGRFDATEHDRYAHNLLPALENLPPIEPNQCYLYFIQAGPFVKVGFSRNPMGRMADLQTSHPNDLQLVAAMACGRASITESAVHRRFLHRRARGEWFALDVELAAFIADVRAQRVSEDTLARV